MKLANKTYLKGSGPVCFSQGILAEQPGQANGNTMTLKDVRIVEEGEAKGHGTWIDAEFVEKTVQKAQNRRIKCRFGHPEMCKESFGTYLGYYDNFRVMEDENGTYAIADLHLAEAANLSPNGKLGDYIMQLSKDAPDLFGNSIVFCYRNTYFKTDKGIKIFGDNYDGHGNLIYTTENGDTYNPSEHGELDTGKVYVDIASLDASDLVDEPAATSGLFTKGDLLTRVATFFGLDFGGMRKTATLRKLIQEFNNMARKEKLSINATIADGSAIVVETDNSFIGVGDMVNDAEGNPVPDGNHDITASDSNQSGITITTAGGTITRIEPTVTQTEQSSGKEIDALSLSVQKLTSDIKALQKAAEEQVKAGYVTKEQYQQMVDRVQALEAQPATDRTILNREDKKAAPEEPVSEYQAQVNAEYERRFGKK
jgi:hypothetical protein